jgi:hypothetical protein
MCVNKEQIAIFHLQGEEEEEEKGEEWKFCEF